MNKLHGTGVALVTPFKQDDSIDYESLKMLLDFTANKGVDYYVVQGTTGESVTTTAKEKIALLEFTLNNNDSDLPIVYGIGGNNTHQVIETIKSTPLEGVDAILSVSPYYNKPSQDGIIAHFRKIADESTLPIILYNVPGRTSSNMTAETTLALAEHPNIIAIKEAAGDLEQVNKIVAHKPNDFLVISGDDMLTPEIYKLGGKGVISVLANSFSDIFKTVKELAFNGNFNEAKVEMNRLLALNELMYLESNPVGIKHLLQLQGICKDYVRLPLLKASDALSDRIKAEWSNI